jgi:hypothetical protein
VFALPATEPGAPQDVCPLKYELYFNRVDDSISNSETLKLRKEREQESLVTFMSHTKDQWASIPALHNWIFAKHGAYSASRLIAPRMEKMDQKTLSTY